MEALEKNANLITSNKMLPQFYFLGHPVSVLDLGIMHKNSVVAGSMI